MLSAIRTLCRLLKTAPSMVPAEPRNLCLRMGQITHASADLSLSLSALGAILLGGTSPSLLAQAGAIEEHRPGALQVAERLFRWPITPWCSTFF